MGRQIEILLNASVRLFEFFQDHVKIIRSAIQEPIVTCSTQ